VEGTVPAISRRKFFAPVQGDARRGGNVRHRFAGDGQSGGNANSASATEGGARPRAATGGRTRKSDDHHSDENARRIAEAGRFALPALVIAVVRDGEVSVKGFGERAGPGSPPPDGDTLMRIGSMTKPFAGLVLAHLAAEGKVQLATPLVALAPQFADAKDPNIAKVRLLDLVTHTGGFPREVPLSPAPAAIPSRRSRRAPSPPGSRTPRSCSSPERR
jgi:CubicO group peptidase (beta-lactamase class C family)